MLDTRADSIIYQSQVKMASLADTLVSKKRVGKEKELTWSKILLMRRLLKSLEYKLLLDDITDANYILEYLIELAEINNFPAAPVLTFQEPPAILVGIQGPAGPTGATGATGATGLATDVQVSNVTVTTVIDSFTVGSAYGCRWDYTVIKSTGAQRSGSVIATWSPTGASIELSDNSTADIVATTEDLEFDVTYSAGNIQLVAVPASGIWNIVATRYFIPNNGTGSGPVSDVLANGKIYIGNVSNQATAQTVSGVILIDNAGVTTFNGSPVSNAHIAAAAGIAVNKLAALTPSIVVGSDASGFLTSTGITTATLTTKLGYVDVASGIQGLINAKLTDPLTTNGDLLYRSGGVSTRLAIGTNGYVLTVSGGLPAWAAIPGGISGLTSGYLPKATSSTTIGNSIISEAASAITIAGTLEIQSGFRTQATGPYLKTKIVDIGDWDMTTTSGVAVAHGLTHLSKIRSVSAMVRNDVALAHILLYDAVSGGYISSVDGTYVNLDRVFGGYFDTADYNSTSYNRGWITIIYEA